MITKLYLIVILLILAVTNVFALEYEKLPMKVWSKGESIFGIEFIAANEEVLDALSQVERPTEKFAVFKYECEFRIKTIQPYVFGSSSSSYSNYVYVPTVYAVRGCERIPEKP